MGRRRAPRSEHDESGPRVGKAVATTLGVLAAVVIAALAARGSTPAGDNRTRKPSESLLDVLFSLYVVGLVGGACLLVYMLVLHRHARITSGTARRQSLLETTLVWIGLLTLGLLVARRLSKWDGEMRAPREDLLHNRTGTLPEQVTSETRTAEFTWLPALITVGLILLAVGAWWFAGRGRKRARGEYRIGLALAVAQALDESLDDLRAEADPRRAVIAAYARLERVLADYGVARRPSEAPFEYLSRILGSLQVADEAIATLTRLFERAKFSHHAVVPEMKEQAITALETVRKDLLAARALAEQARAEALRAQQSAGALR